MKKNYTAPEFEVELFEAVVMDVVDGSGGTVVLPDFED